MYESRDDPEVHMWNNSCAYHIDDGQRATIERAV